MVSQCVTTAGWSGSVMARILAYRPASRRVTRSC